MSKKVRVQSNKKKQNNFYRHPVSVASSYFGESKQKALGSHPQTLNLEGMHKIIYKLH